MPFLTKLNVSMIDKREYGRQMWRVESPLVYESSDRIYTVPSGFETDFASVPRLPFAYWLTGDSAHAAAVVHDYLYVSKLVDKKTADAVFKEAMDDMGIGWLKRNTMYLAVRAFGGRFS